MKKLKTFVLRVARIKALKYIVVTVFAVALIGFVDENSVWSHYRNKQRIAELQAETKQYQEQNRRNREQIRRIDSDPKAMEKIARERYFMKAEDEDIFVLSDDDQQTATPDETAD